MFNSRLIATTLVSVLVWQSDGSAEPAQGRKIALLIGCTRYEILPQRKHLKGPANDVVMMRRLLVDQFGFATEDVRVLAEHDHIQKAEAAQGLENAIICELPTDANIAAEFERLIDNAQPGDHIFILMAGHGSRQPDFDQNTERDAEPDGLDELFLPRNYGRYNPEIGGIEHAITDDQLREWMAGLVGKGAFVFLVADACHSSSVARGATFEDSSDQSRNVSPEELGIPAAALEAAREHTAGQKSSEADWFDVAAATAGTSGAVALYAAQPHQEAKEYAPVKPGPVFGRLSHMLHELLSQCGQRITYRELAQRVLWRFEQNGWISQSTPEIEGTALDRTVLDLPVWPDRSLLTLHHSPRGDSLTAGALHGMTTGSILAVYPPAGTPNEKQLAGYVRVRQVYPLSADVEPLAWNEIAFNDHLPDEGRCEVVFREQSSEQLTLNVVSEATGSDASALNDKVLHALTASANVDGARFRLVTDAPADWTAVVVDSGVYLQQSSSPRFAWTDKAALDNARRRGEVFGDPYPVDERLGDVIARTMERISRAVVLRRLAEESAVAGDPSVDVAVELLQDGVEIRPGDAAPTLKTNDVVRLRIVNKGLEPAAVLVFYIDTSFGIEQRFPRSVRDDRINQIPIGGALEKQLGFQINDETIGWEHVIVIAVGAKDRGVLGELQRLRQESLADSGSRSRAVTAPFESPLARLLDTSLTGTRGEPTTDSIPAPGSFAIRRVTWNVVRSENPSPRG